MAIKVGGKGGGGYVRRFFLKTEDIADEEALTVSSLP